MPDCRPLVSIGLPVFNGEQYLREALDSLTAQDYEDFELIISDNASTDQTEVICREYAARDCRIRYHRNETNLGPAKNFNRVFELSNGKYFMWAAHDDLWEAGYLRNCIAALENDVSKVLCCTSLRFIDEAGRTIELEYDRYDNPDLSSSNVRKRVRTLVSRSGWYAIYGLIRADALRRTELSRETYGADVLLLMQLCLLGPFAKVPQILFWYRQFEGRTEEDRAKTVHAEIRPDYKALVLGLIRIVLSSNLGSATKLLVTWDILSVVHSSESPLRHHVGPSRLRSIISLLKTGGRWA
jgi:glycosyltransferase involved in cell wall biosynthesis